MKITNNHSKEIIKDKIFHNDNFKNNIKLFYGINSISRFKLLSKLEINYDFVLSTNKLKSSLLTLEVKNNLISFNYLNYIKFTIIFFDLLQIYKSYRHFRGFPVRGQRTWSNGNSCFRANNILRVIKLKWATKFYNSVNAKNVKIGLVSEYVNILWFTQWTEIWLKAQKLYQKKKINDTKSKKINLMSLSEYQISIPIKTNDTRQLTKKQKSLMTDSFYLLGFKMGFSKKILTKKF